MNFVGSGSFTYKYFLKKDADRIRSASLHLFSIAEINYSKELKVPLAI